MYSDRLRSGSRRLRNRARAVTIGVPTNECGEVHDQHPDGWIGLRDRFESAASDSVVGSCLVRKVLTLRSRQEPQPSP